MTVAVVILNWNGLDLLQKFLPTVVKYSPNAHIYVADNNSTDASEQYVTSNFPEVTWIQNGANLGYAGGYQKALTKVHEDIYILLNSDIEVTNNWITPHIEAFKNNDKVVATQPKIKDYNRKEYFEYAGAAGGFIDKYGFPYCRGRIFETIEKDMGQYDNSCPIFWASGACLIVKREAYWAAGGLDPDFFAHQEEIDLCWRLQLNNGEIYSIPKSTVYHIGGATLHKSSPQKTFYNFRNSLFMLYKNLPKKEVFPIIFTRLCLDGIAGIRFIFQAKFLHCWAIVRAHFSFYKHLSELKPKRKQIQLRPIHRNKLLIIKEYFLKGRNTYKLLQKTV